jgi:hypothetical protein
MLRRMLSSKDRVADGHWLKRREWVNLVDLAKHYKILV